MVGLMAIEVGCGHAQHHVKHLGHCLSHETLNELFPHGNINAHRVKNIAAFKACRNHDVVGLIHVSVIGDHLGNPAVVLAKLHHLFTGNEVCPQLPGPLIVAKGDHQGVGMAVAGTPGRADHLVGHIGIDFMGLGRIQHDHIKAHFVAAGGQLGQLFNVLRGLAQTQVALLLILDVHTQFFTQVGPDVLHRIHGQRQLPHITGGLTNTAGVPAGTAVTDHFALQNQGLEPLPTQIISCGIAYNTAAYNDHICAGAHFSTSCSIISLPYTLISMGRAGVRAVLVSSSLGRTPSSRATIACTSFPQVRPWHSPMPVRR